MISVLMPSTVGPPIEKNTNCRIRPTSTVGKMAQPSTNPIRPLRTRWTDEPHIGIWMAEATKKADPSTAALGICSSSNRRSPIIVPTAAATVPARSTPCPAGVAVRRPSEICIARPHFAGTSFTGMSTVLTHISPPNSTSTGLPAGFFIFSSPVTSAANPHQPARGIV